MFLFCCHYYSSHLRSRCWCRRWCSARCARRYSALSRICVCFSGIRCPHVLHHVSYHAILVRSHMLFIWVMLWMSMHMSMDISTTLSFLCFNMFNLFLGLIRFTTKGILCTTHCIDFCHSFSFSCTMLRCLFCI